MNECSNYLVQIWGLVQGVGMRPFIYRIATSFHLTGFVKNQGASVVMHISGRKENISEFLHMLTQNHPKNARIEKMEQRLVVPKFYQDFAIIESSSDDNHLGLLLPDLAICDDCLADIKNHKDRHHYYAFTNCTNCGPRYSIIKALPYDRRNTAMTSFHMCTACKTEYVNPVNRRFHAEPISCSQCGPQYRLVRSNGDLVYCEDPVQKVQQLLKKGKIIAIKGIGGYHLTCNAMDENAVMQLRNRKKRPDRPFAIMASTIKAAEKICLINQLEAETLENNKRPIVLLAKNSDHILPEVIAPKLTRYGVLLPYTGIHYLLFDDYLQYLVMTSGNKSGMPICYQDDEALKNLCDVADYFFIHNREIQTPIDDSVVKILEDDLLVSRCGRGYAPTSLKVDSNTAILALGGQQKSSICLFHKGYAHISQYLNTLDNMETCSEYSQVVNRFTQLLKANPQVVVRDINSDYYAAKYAKTLKQKTLSIQHHHAHMAGCMAEHQLVEDVLGIIFDGTGLGLDGAVWGGEFFVGTRKMFKRVAHLAYVTIQGGETSIKEPWRCAASYAYSQGVDISPLLPSIDKLQIDLLTKSLDRNINCFQSSSMGRLFDCVAAVLLQRTHITYDAQAAIELEAILDDSISDDYFCPVTLLKEKGPYQIEYKELLRGILADMQKGTPISVISTKFHNTICNTTVQLAVQLSKIYKVNTVVLSGGVFENTYLLKNILAGLKEYSFKVYINKQVPLNDGGLSFGQAAAAASIIGGK